MSDHEQNAIIEEFLNNGEKLYDLGNYTELAQLCEEFLESITDERVYSMLSSTQFALGDIVMAEKNARKGLALNSHNIDHLLNLAYILQHNGSFSNAMRYFIRAKQRGDAATSRVCEEAITQLEVHLKKTAAELLPLKAAKRVLIIAAIFPPEAGSGVQRTLKLVKYLRLFNWEPVVLTLPLSNDPSFTGFEYFDELPDDIEVIRIPVPSAVTSQNIENMKNKLLPLLTEKTREEFENSYNRQDWPQKYNLCSFPEHLVSWAYNAAENIANYLDLSNIDLIYSTSGPYCDHFAAYYIKQNYHKPWVVDFRDEWSNNPAIWPNKNNLLYRMCLDCERALIDTADKVICVTEKSLDNYVKLGFSKEKLACITNGFDEEDFEGISDNSAANEKFTLVHNGLLYLDRTPKTILTALRNLIKRKKIDAEKIIFYMGCFTNKENNVALETEVKRMGLEKIAFITPYMEHRASLLYAASANLLLLILGPSTNYVATYPAKIFEYLRLSKPILSLGPGGSVIEFLLRKTGGGINVKFSDTEAIEKEILRHYQAWLTQSSIDKPSEADIIAYERKNLVAKHAQEFDKALYEQKSIKNASSQKYDIDLLKLLNEEYKNKKVVKNPPQQYDDSFKISEANQMIDFLSQKMSFTGVKILEIGCGGGYTSYQIAKRFNCKIVGVDIYEDAAWQRNVHKNVQYKCVDLGVNNPFNEEEFDIIISIVAWEHMKHPFEILQQATKVLKRGGSFFIRANQYRSAIAHHLYRQIYFPYPHLLFDDELVIDFAVQNGAERWYAEAFYYINKLTYPHYKEYFKLLKLDIIEESMTNRPLDYDFYQRFNDKLGLYPINDLELDFFNVLLKKTINVPILKR
ncbi:MAG: methyltransferase domain-containing protein [Firmicutes bacterium]|nr:methyltransferase domain-containing protein [Bacillota bacterium]